MTDKSSCGASGMPGFPVDRLAPAALVCDVADLSGANQDYPVALVETPLADIVRRHRAAWIAGIGAMHLDTCPRAINAYAGSQLEKRVLAALGEGCFRFSQFLASFEYLVLQGQELGVVGEEAVFRLEELLVYLGRDSGQRT